MATGITRVNLTHPTYDLVIDTSSKHRTVDTLQHALAGFASSTLPVTASVTQDVAHFVDFSGPAAPGDTVTINGVVITAGQLHARGSVTFAGLVEDEVFKINGNSLTAKVAPVGPAEFALGASDLEAAASATAVIKAHPAFGGVVTASTDGVSPVVNLRAVRAGVSGNGIPLETLGAGISVSGATLSGGVAPDGTIWDTGDTAAQSATSLRLVIPLAQIPITSATVGAVFSPAAHVALTANLITGAVVSLEASGANITTSEPPPVGAVFGGELTF
jgi:hypothetical protein